MKDLKLKGFGKGNLATVNAHGSLFAGSIDRPARDTSDGASLTEGYKCVAKGYGPEHGVKSPNGQVHTKG